MARETELSPWERERLGARKAFGDEVLHAKLQDEILHNQRIKEYPQGFAEVLTASRAVFREPGYEKAGKWAPEPRQRREAPMGGEAADGDPIGEADDEAQREARKAENTARAVRRARQKLRDLALCNGMKYFVTLTLDSAKIDRRDMAAITRKLNVWCNNQVQRNGFAYILVPERHQDGAIHFHGFVNDAVEAVDSGTLSLPWDKKPRRPRSKAQRTEWIAKGGKVVYNLPDWPLGFTTAIELYGDPVAAVNYCCKYIGKTPEKIGGRWFYHGGCSQGPKITYNDVDFDTMALTDHAYAWEVPAAGAVFIREKINY